MEFPTNLLISGKSSSSKILFVEIEETVSESVFSSKTISFLEIVRAAEVLVEVPLVLTFKSESIFSTISRVLDWEVLTKVRFLGYDIFEGQIRPIDRAIQFADKFPNIVKALTLNIVSSGYHMEEGSKPFALIYRIYYKLMGT